MSEKWTPGPWFVRDLGPTKDGYPYFIIQAGGPDIGDGFVGDEYFSLAGIMTRETAALVSAAPDLYAQLKELCDSCMGQCDDCRVSDILKKARGES